MTAVLLLPERDKAGRLQGRQKAGKSPQCVQGRKLLSKECYPIPLPRLLPLSLSFPPFLSPPLHLPPACLLFSLVLKKILGFM